MSQFLKYLLADDTGQDLIEYALVAALIGVAVMSGMRLLKNSLATAFNAIGTTLTSSV